jgi:hypothetical protein
MEVQKRKQPSEVRGQSQRELDRMCEQRTKKQACTTFGGHACKSKNDAMLVVMNEVRGYYHGPRRCHGYDD